MIKRILFLSLLAAGVAAAQQRTSLVAGDPLACFSRTEGGASFSLVDVQGQPFTRALRITTPPNSGANAWSIRVRCFNSVAAQKGDTALATFWMRTVSPQAVEGFTTFVVEKGMSPWTKSVEFTAAAGPEWKKIEIPFTLAEAYTAGAYNLSFWVTFDPQIIEIGGLTIDNWGPSFPYDGLGLTTWPYAGRALDAPWRKEAARRIEKHRKSDILVVARDGAGNPIANAPVRVRMKRHAFGFGTAVAGDALRDAQYGKVLLENFNKAVIENDLKWPFWETWGRPNADFALPWLQANGMAQVRGHTAIWPGNGNLPVDVPPLIETRNLEALRKRINDHITAVLTYTRGKVTEWDVLNEPFTNKDVQAVLGDAEMAEWFKLARRVDPDIKLYINDYDIVEKSGYDLPHQNGYFNIIKGILDRGGPIDGIGIQGHFGTGLTEPERVWQIYDRFASFGKELQVTEFDVSVGDDQVQADYLRDFMTASFAHPAVSGFMVWGFWEGRHWKPESAMWRRDWSIKPNGQTWRDLIFKEWWTDVQGTTGPDGVFRTRGFLGDYEVEVALPGGPKIMPLTVKAAHPNYVVPGRAPAPSTLGGLANAAGYTAGAVAPGEMVTLFGTGFGGGLVHAYGDADGQLPSFLSDTRVLFDGKPAPLVYTFNGQVSAIVPYGVSGSTDVQIESQGALSPPLRVPVREAVPGLFTDNYQGTGQAVAVNQDGRTRNSAAAPAARGEFVSLFVTGEGAVTPGVRDGFGVAAPHPRPVLPVRVFFGDAESPAADLWVGLVYAGVTQINARIPMTAPAGATVPVRVQIGDASSQTGPTIVIR